MADPLIIKKTSLSYKQQELRDRLFHKKQAQSAQDPSSRPSSSNDLTTQKQIGGSFPTPQVINENMNEFLSSMNNELRKMGSNALAADVVLNQNNILRSHSETLAANQKAIASMLASPQMLQSQNNTFNSSNGNKMEENSMMQQLFKTMSQQTAEIRQIYTETKQLANQITGMIKMGHSGSSSDRIGDVDLDQKLDSLKSQTRLLNHVFNKTEKGLEGAKKRNITQQEHKMVDTFSKAVAVLKSDIESLQMETGKMQMQLDRKVTNLQRSQSSKEQTNLLVESIKGIDLQASRNSLMERLGEFNYSSFLNQTSEISQKASAIHEDYQEQIKSLWLPDPQFSLTLEEKRALKESKKVPGVLDMLKARISGFHQIDYGAKGNQFSQGFQAKENFGVGSNMPGIPGGSGYNGQVVGGYAAKSSSYGVPELGGFEMNRPKGNILSVQENNFHDKKKGNGLGIAKGAGEDRETSEEIQIRVDKEKKQREIEERNRLLKRVQKQAEKEKALREEKAIREMERFKPKKDEIDDYLEYLLSI